MKLRTDRWCCHVFRSVLLTIAATVLATAADYLGSFTTPIQNPGFEEVKDDTAQDWHILNATLTTKPGATAAGKVRIVTQAGNLGTVSTGKEGELLAGLYYIDIPLQVIVQ